LGQLLFAQSGQQSHAARPPEYTYKIVKSFPHDPNAFTQGLVYRDGFLYEGTGLKGQSSLRKVRLETGEVVQQIDRLQNFLAKALLWSRTKSYNSPGSRKRDSSTTSATFTCCAVFPIPVKAGV
jgi:glutamine cyclotransferase